MRYCKIFSCLLDYPTAELWQEKSEIIREIQLFDELNTRQKMELTNFVDSYFSMPLLDAQAMYYQTFEVGNQTSLLLFEHVHGDSRERGQAMVDLIEKYSAQDIELSENQLPDYLPLFLEYLSLLPASECQIWLKNIALIITLIAIRLEKKENQYQVLFQLLYQLSEHEIDDTPLRDQVAAEKSDDTTEAIDQAWQETQVLFQGSINASNNKSMNHSTYYVTVGDAPRSC